ncbi:MAG TPA: hypothetical protein VF218_06315 [Acidothermaceae bacterium]
MSVPDSPPPPEVELGWLVATPPLPAGVLGVAPAEAFAPLLELLEHAASASSGTTANAPTNLRRLR